MSSDQNEPQPMSKRIIICCDGTWQSAVNGEANTASNVTRLARNLERITTDANGKRWQQIVWYDSGVGTTSGWLGKQYEGLVGAGLELNVIEAYNFVALNWEVGDQVLCFGFSRGAYTARTIAGLISDIGICEPRKLHEFPEIWKLIKNDKSGDRFYGSDSYFMWLDGVLDADKQPEDRGYKNSNMVWDKFPHGEWAVTAESRDIEVVGVYDTVGGLGMPDILGVEVSLPFGPDKKGFHNVQLNPNIKHAFHALALDEHRSSYTPTLWSLPDTHTWTPEEIAKQEEVVENARDAWWMVRDDKKTPKAKRDELYVAYNEARRKLIRMEEANKPQSQLQQVWFPGYHINIGGGSTNTLRARGDLEEMSNITFAWMLDRIKPYVGIRGRSFEQDTIQRQLYLNELNEQLRKYEELVANQQEEQAKESYWAWTTRSISAAYTSAKTSVLHPFTEVKKPNTLRRDYGWGTGTFIDTYSTMSVTSVSKFRTPGAYSRDKKYTVVGRTNEFIHPTTGYRIEMTKNLTDERLRYKPAGQELESFKRQKTADGKGWEYVIAGLEKPLPEFEIDPPQEEICYERIAISSGDPRVWEYVEQLDRELGYSAPAEQDMLTTED